VSFYAFFKRWLLPGLLPNNIYQKKTLILEILVNFNIRSGLSPSRLSTFALKVCLIKLLVCIRRFLIKIKIAQSHTSLFIFSTSIDFAENQLSLSLISLSPLITIHLRILQHPRVQSFLEQTSQ